MKASRRAFIQGAALAPVAAAVLPDTWKLSMCSATDWNKPQQEQMWEVIWRNMITDDYAIKLMPGSEIMGGKHDSYGTVSGDFIRTLPDGDYGSVPMWRRIKG